MRCWTGETWWRSGPVGARKWLVRYELGGGFGPAVIGEAFVRWCPLARWFGGGNAHNIDIPVLTKNGITLCPPEHALR